MTNWTPTNILGINLTTNSGFSTPTGWTLGTGWSYGTDDVIHAGAPIGVLSQSVAITAGVRYRVSINVISPSGGLLNVFLGGDSIGLAFTSGTNIIEGVAGSGNSLLEISGSDDWTLTDILVQEYTPTSWTELPDPTGISSVTTGFAYGLLMAITRPETTFSDNWTRIAAPSKTWTIIPEP